MASLTRIENMRRELEAQDRETAPDWILLTDEEIDDLADKFTDEVQPGQHVSGALRSIAEDYFQDNDHFNLNMWGLLMMAAERLDDAHEEWMEERLATWERNDSDVDRIESLSAENSALKAALRVARQNLGIAEISVKQ